MFERFTGGARLAVMLSQEEARRLRHQHIGTEHMLLGLLRAAEDVSAGALADLGLDLEATRAAVERIIQRGSAEPEGHIPFTPRARKVLEFALREAVDLGDAFIAGEHLLLGIVHQGGGVAAQILVDVAGPLDRVRQAVMTRRTEAGRSAPKTAVQDFSEEGLLRHVVGLATDNAARHELPFAALVVRGEQLLGVGVDSTRPDHDPTAHAEIVAIRAACRRLRIRRLVGATLVASCEPCAMCQAAALAAGVERIVYAAPRSAVATLGESVLQMRAPPADHLVHVPVDGADEPFRRYREQAG